MTGVRSWLPLLLFVLWCAVVFAFGLLYAWTEERRWSGTRTYDEAQAEKRGRL